MKNVKKIEIVIDSLELNKLLKVVEKAGVSGYTIIKDAAGKGERGIKEIDGLTDVFKNSYVLIACTAEQAEQVVELVRPFMKRVGGMCLVSDAEYIVH